MTGGRAEGLHRDLDLVAGSGSVVGLDDAELLRLFAARRGDAAEAAFEAIVARHGPMVLRVCRGVLRHPADADDAFQATFLVLVRKAGSVRVSESLAPWLYGVARRVATKAKAVDRKRRTRETTGLEAGDGPRRGDATAWLDLRPILFEELDRLPEKYRSPVLLCHFEGLSHEEAAMRLRWPVGTLSGRLSRARGLLRSRLARRGLVVSAAHLAGGILTSRADAIPFALVRSTARLSVTSEAGGTLPTSLLTLARGAQIAMIIDKLKFAAIVGSTLAMLTIASGYVSGQIGASPKPAGAIAATHKPEANEAAAIAKPGESAKSRLELARRSYAEIEKWIIEPPAERQGPTAVGNIVLTDQLALWSRRWMEAERELNDSKAARVASVAGHLKRLETWGKLYEELIRGESSGVTEQSFATLKFHQLEARDWLAREKAGN